MKPVPATEDRIWAVIAHLSAVAFGMGILLPVIGWSEQRRKSNFTSFQCLQALGYQSLGYTVWFLVYLLVTVILVIIIVIALPVVAAENVQFDKFMLGWMSILIVFMFGMLRSEEHTSDQSQSNLVCRLLLEKKKKNIIYKYSVD